MNAIYNRNQLCMFGRINSFAYFYFVRIVWKKNEITNGKGIENSTDIYGTNKNNVEM